MTDQTIQHAESPIRPLRPLCDEEGDGNLAMIGQHVTCQQCREILRAIAVCYRPASFGCYERIG